MVFYNSQEGGVVIAQHQNKGLNVLCIGPSNVEIFFRRQSLDVGDDSALDELPDGKHDVKSIGRRFVHPESVEYFLCVADGKKSTDLSFLAPGNIAPMPAGSALNVAVGLHRLGMQTTLLTSLPSLHHAEDFLANGIVSYIEDLDIGLALLPRPSTPVTIVVVDGDNGDRKSTVLSYKPLYTIPRSRSDLMIREIVKARLACALATGIRLPELAIVARIFRMLKQQDPPAITGFIPNPTILSNRKGDVWNLLMKVLSRTDFFQMNAREASFFLGKKECDLRFPHDIQTIAERVRGCGVRIVIVTRGAQGVSMFRLGDNQYFEDTAYPVAGVVDTTGAGDAFLTAMIYAKLIKTKLTVDQAIRVASFSAALNVTKMGGHGGMPTREKLQKFIETITISSTSSGPGSLQR